MSVYILCCPERTLLRYNNRYQNHPSPNHNEDSDLKFHFHHIDQHKNAPHLLSMHDPCLHLYGYLSNKQCDYFLYTDKFVYYHILYYFSVKL